MASQASPIKLGKSVQPDLSVLFPCEALFSKVGPIKMDPLSRDQEKDLHALFTQTVNDLTGSPHDFLVQIGADETASDREKIKKAYHFALNLSGHSPIQSSKSPLGQAFDSMRMQAENLKIDRIVLWDALKEAVGSQEEQEDYNGLPGIHVARAFGKWLYDNKARLGQVRSLDLSSSGFVFLPPEIGLLTQLENLNLDGNQLESLPQSMGNLKNLRSLSVVVNHLESLPNAIGNLTNLRFLSLVQNRLETLPETIGQLTGLHSLYLGTNPLKKLPDSFKDLVSLKTFDLADCEFEHQLGRAKL